MIYTLTKSEAHLGRWVVNFQQFTKINTGVQDLTMFNDNICKKVFFHSNSKGEKLEKPYHTTEVQVEDNKKGCCLVRTLFNNIMHKKTDRMS